METNNENNPLNRVFRWKRCDDNESNARDGVTYQLLAEEPHRIENWIKILQKDEPGVTPILSLTSVNSVYAEKCISFKWPADLNIIAIEKCEGRGIVRLGHVVRDRYEIGLTFYGNVLFGKLVRVTNVNAAKTIDPVLMALSPEEELSEYIRMDATYTNTEVVPGYESDQIDNQRILHILEEEMEMMLENNGYVFSDDGKSFHKFCMYCECVPCVWTNNEHSMIQLEMTENEADVSASSRRDILYRHMERIIKDGKLGMGNKTELPECVVEGVKYLVRDTDENETGHRFVE